MSFPRTPDQITTEWINEVLQNSGVDDHVRSIEIKPAKEGYGIMGILSIVNLQYESVDHSGPNSLFAKFSSENGFARYISTREVNFYHDFADLCSVRIPACYFAASENDESALIIEHFAEGHSGDSGQGCTRDEAELLFLSAAELHAQWWDSPKLTELDWVTRFSVDGMAELPNLARNALPGFMEKLGSLIPAWAEQVLVKGIERLPDVIGKLASGPSTLVHGDMQLDNVWFGLPDAPIALLDWQLLARAQPGWDIAWFFNYSYLPEERRKNEDYLLDAYIKRLHQLGVTDYSLAALREYMRVATLFAFAVTPLNVQSLDFSSERATQNLLFDIKCFLAMLEDYEVGDLAIP